MDNRVIDIVNVHEHILNVFEIWHRLEISIASLDLPRHLCVVHPPSDKLRRIVNILRGDIRVLTVPLYF